MSDGYRDEFRFGLIRELFMEGLRFVIDKEV